MTPTTRRVLAFSCLACLLVALGAATGQEPARPAHPSLHDPELRYMGLNRQGVEEYLHVQTQVVFVLVPAGEFAMGSPLDEPDRRDDERPHRVRLTKPFLFGKLEVTNAQFQRFRPEHSSGLHGDLQLDLPQQPVVLVTWADAWGFCNWGHVRLPTEAEWEYAVRAGKGSVYPWGDAWPPPRGAGNFRDAFAARFLDHGLEDYTDNFIVSAPVGTFTPNGLGIHDLAGNVMEWCADRYGPYPAEEPALDPVGPATGSTWVRRGGSWSTERLELRTARRGEGPQDENSAGLGFRVARSVPEP
ncbi:MAG: SUMF1/EgtB/PvdO family nonheme iron enzyme [Planctomycetes bacterium]|nr:SUMF1/EgtB/PvdO family nonheme iron enzyme [Planctomycetota bacterium]